MEITISPDNMHIVKYIWKLIIFSVCCREGLVLLYRRLDLAKRKRQMPLKKKKKQRDNRFRKEKKEMKKNTACPRNQNSSYFFYQWKPVCVKLHNVSSLTLFGFQRTFFHVGHKNEDTLTHSDDKGICTHTHQLRLRILEGGGDLN